MPEIKTKLDSMTKTCRCVIDLPIKRRMLDVCDDLSAANYRWAMIFHDKDVNHDGKLKTRHFHLVFECPKRHRLSFYIARISEYFNVERCQVQIQVSNSFAGDIQYLIHKNNKDKYQYPEKDIITNLAQQELNDYLSEEVHQQLTASYIMEVVKGCATKTDVILKLGIGNYNVFHSIVETFCRDGWLGYYLHNGDKFLEENNL